ncbi:MAG TPA: hypothetical protein VN408_42100 [Actinoplanes sp.]|nr:hypothetical protein [Actinoplanes sp.]
MGGKYLAKRQSVPTWMIAACTTARESGDWRAACAVAGVEVLFDDAGPAADLLAGFAPDLLRWHLPRRPYGSPDPVPDNRYLLAPGGAVTADTTVLLVSTFRTGRLTLERMPFRDLPAGEILPVPAPLWDARSAAGLGAAPDPEAAVRSLDAEIRHWTEAGWAVTRRRHLDQIDTSWAAGQVRGLTGRLGVRPRPLASVGDRIRAWWSSTSVQRRGPVLTLHLGLLMQPVDRALVRLGHLTPAALHPLVRAALFPDAPDEPQVIDPAGRLTDEIARVRCRDAWHRIKLSRGRFEPLDHAGDLVESDGCRLAERAWDGGGGRVPRQIREYRRDLFRRIDEGGAWVLGQMLDAGLEPLLRDSEGRTLIHRLYQSGDPSMLHRLLTAGIRLDDRDRNGSTALAVALRQDWPYRYTVALIDAGAELPETRFLDGIDRMWGHADAKRAVAYLKRKNPQR